MVARRASVPPHTVHVARVPVQTIVTARPAVVRSWVRSARWRLPNSGAGRTVGLGVQWTPPPHAGAEPRLGTLQLCAGNRCLVFQIGQSGGAVPTALRRFLADGSVTFAAYGVAVDCRLLRERLGLEVASTLELRAASGMARASMELMASEHLGLRGLTKSKKVARSAWHRAELSKKQIRYACVDAYLSWRLGVHLRRRRRDEEEEEEEASSDASSVHGVIRGGDYGGDRQVFMLGRIGAHPGYHHDDEEDCGVEDYDDDDDDDIDSEDYVTIDGPEYSPDRMYAFDRMVGAIFALRIGDDVQDDEHRDGCACNACFPQDVEKVEQEPFPSIISVLA